MMSVGTLQSGTSDENGYVVRRPRVTDALGKALREAFEPSATSLLPADMQRTLQRIDRCGG